MKSNMICFQAKSEYSVKVRGVVKKSFKLSPFLKCLILLVMVFFMAGCTSDTTDSSAVGNRTIVITHDISDELPNRVDYFHFSYFDGTGKQINETIKAPKSQRSVLTEVPADISRLGIEYYDCLDTDFPLARQDQQRSEIIGSIHIPVELPPHGIISLDVVGDPTSQVNFVKTGNRWDVYIAGQKSYLKGIGGDYAGSDPDEFTYSYLNEAFTSSGANTIRTYGVPDLAIQVRDAKAALALAKKLSTDDKKIMVLVGFVFKYIPDPVALNQDAFDQILSDPNSDHVLGWCLGNEAVDAANPNATLNQQINEVAGYIQKKSKLPIMTAVANPTADALKTYAKMDNLDCLAINTFFGKFNDEWQGGGFLNTLGPTMKSWEKPWIVSEYYSYDLPSEGFGSYKGMPSQLINGYQYFLELNSTANAQNYTDSWTKYILPYAEEGNVGGFALNWMPPHNSQVPGFWKHMFVFRGEWEIYVNWYKKYGADRLECVDAVTALYGGKIPADPCPKINIPADGDPQGIECNFKATLDSPGTPADPGQKLTASITATGGDNLTFDWYLIGGRSVTASGGGITDGPSINTYKAWGAETPNEPVVTSHLLGHGQSVATGNGAVKNTIIFTLDESTHRGNNYQLRVIVRNGKGGAATSAVGFAVSK